MWGWSLLTSLPASPQFLHLLKQINPALLKGICEGLMRVDVKPLGNAKVLGAELWSKPVVSS